MRMHVYLYLDTAAVAYLDIARKNVLARARGILSLSKYYKIYDCYNDYTHVKYAWLCDGLFDLTNEIFLSISYTHKKSS